MDVEEQFYFKPDAGKLLLSPADESPCEPHDVQPEEWDVAVAVDRVERATTLQVSQISHRWAGLRSFVPDRRPVVGFDTAAQGFFWAAAQGGYGIQTAPGLAETAAALIQNRPLPARIVDCGVDLADISPARLRA
jgi:D-arginine dehydrogenase